jgi:hypothetical protein
MFPKMPMKMGPEMEAPEVEDDMEEGQDMNATIEALEQARAALDAVEATLTGARREKLKGPTEVPGETAGATDEQE